MDKQNISKQIRKYIYKQIDLIDTTFNNLNDEEKANIFFQSMDNIESNSKIHLLNGYNIPAVLDFGVLKTTTILSRVQLYTDYYRSVKLQDELYGTEVLKSFPKIRSYNDLKRFFSTNINKYEMLESLKEYYFSSGFDKVLFAKCLEENDVKHLKSINPFFEYEYNKCNVNVDLDFIVKHIKKWQKYFPQDINLSYIQASKFIFDLYKLRKEEAENLLIELFREDLGIISSTNNDEETITMGQVKINENNLAIMFKDYYKYQEKVLKKRR